MLLVACCNSLQIVLDTAGSFANEAGSHLSWPHDSKQLNLSLLLFTSAAGNLFWLRCLAQKQMTQLLHLTGLQHACNGVGQAAAAALVEKQLCQLCCCLLQRCVTAAAQQELVVVLLLHVLGTAAEWCSIMPC
jgi:hypothetical protein